MTADLFTYQEVEELLETVLNNQTFRQIDADSGTRFVIFRHPTTAETIQSRYRRQLALVQAQAEGLASRSDIEKAIVQRKILSAADEERIKELDAKVSAQRRLLQITKIEGRRKPILETIERYESELHKLRSKGQEWLYLSSEAKAEEEALLYLSYVGTYNTDLKPYWSSYEEFGDEQDIVFRTLVTQEFTRFSRGLPTKTIRYLARHSLWRIRYMAALKSGGQLFCEPLYNLTPDQLGLLHWSDYYQMIYDLLPDDKPEQEVIDDDEALDAHVSDIAKRRQEERNQGKAKRRGGNKGPKLSAWDRGEELIITAAHPQYMNMTYSEDRIKASDGAADVEVMSPNSRRARNRASLRRNRRAE